MGLLFNRNHRFHDLILPVDADQKAMLDAIDGEHSVGQIAQRTGPGRSDKARDVFEALWRHDQVALDISAAAG